MALTRQYLFSTSTLDLNNKILKIERWHQKLKIRILLENYFLPGDLERQIESFVKHYNHERYHESLKNFTPVDVYFSRAQSILKRVLRNDTKMGRQVWVNLCKTDKVSIRTALTCLAFG